jgi:hypothetical protein
MNSWRIVGILAVLILGFSFASGCANTESANNAPMTVSTSIPVYEPASTPTLFSDKLINRGSNWDAEYDNSDGKVFYSADGLHLRDNMPPVGSMYHTLNMNFNNFILDVDTKVINGSVDNWQGIYIRLLDENNNYNLAVSGDGYYSIVKTQNGITNSLIGEIPRSGFINAGIGPTNHIHIEAKDNSLSLSVNGHHLKTITDDAFTDGMVALSANCLTSDSFTEVVFNNIVITRI